MIRVSEDFPAAQGVQGTAVELKICEWGCGGAFIREVPVSARYGQKVCPRCIEERRLDAERRRQAAADDTRKSDLLPGKSWRM